MALAIEYVSDFTSVSGYGKASRNHARALIEQGVDVRTFLHRHDAIVCQDSVFDTFWKNWWPVTSGKVDPRRIRLIHETPEFWAPDPRRYNIGMVAWETDRIPNHPIGGLRQNNWVAQMNEVAEVWTFSTFAKQAFEASGVTVPVRVLGHPVDGDIYKPSLAPDWNRDLKGRFVFVTCGQLTERKDFQDLLIAYLTEFRKDRKVALLFKTYQNDFSPEQQAAVEEWVRQIRVTVKIPIEEQPDIYLLQRIVPEEEMAGVYCSGQAFVWASRGEGFCQPIAESMACGVPVVTHLYSSMADLVDVSCGVVYNHWRVPVYGMPHIPWYASDQDWAQPDVRDLQRKMRWCVENPAALKDLGQMARQRILDRFSYNRIGRLMVDYLSSIPRIA